MIFLTVGTTRFSFDRLLKTVDEAMCNLRLNEQLIVQSGVSDYQFKYPNVKVFKDLPFNKMVYYLKNARVVITHGGPATIFLALKYAQNQPLVVPRLVGLNEHVNSHQEIFTVSLAQKGLIKTILPSQKLKEGLAIYLKKPNMVKDKRNLEPDQKLIQNLISYTERLAPYEEE